MGILGIRAIRVLPNLTWLVILILAVCRWQGLLNTWVALTLFVAYFFTAFLIMRRNPEIQREAEKFKQQLILDRQRKEAERIKRELIGAVEIKIVSKN